MPCYSAQEEVKSHLAVVVFWILVLFVPMALMKFHRAVIIFQVREQILTPYYIYV